MRHLVLAIMVGLASGGAAADFGIDPGGGTDTVKFESSARLEFVEGRTSDIAGGFTVDPENMAAGVRGVVRVDLRSLKTGIDLRDRHMRENHLHTDRYPYAYFELTEVQGLPLRLAAGETVRETVRGTGSGWFYIHGGRRPLRVEVEATPVRQGAEETWGIRVRGKFAIKLDDFGIERPKALFLKLAEKVEVEVVFIGYRDRSGVQIEVPEWPTRE